MSLLPSFTPAETDYLINRDYKYATQRALRGIRIFLMFYRWMGLLVIRSCLAGRLGNIHSLIRPQIR
jgi:hypothetical protein